MDSARTSLLRALPQQRHHYWPLRLIAEADRAALLVRSLTSSRLGKAEVVLQLLFQPTSSWERGIFSTSYEAFLAGQTGRLKYILDARASEAPYHVEIRASATTLQPQELERTLWPWICSWSGLHGGSWWSPAAVKPRRHEEFWDALTNHDIERFASKKGRRDISATELSGVLPIPWRERHRNVSYAGAPEGQAPLELLARSPGSSGLMVGTVGSDSVCLPPRWNHLAILGRTRTGKSTLAESLVLEILQKQPKATVVVLEPTGVLIGDTVARLPAEVAQDTIEIDPSRTTFEREGVEHVAVPLNLLRLPDRGEMDAAEIERRAEKLSGDLLQSIKNAWGEESVGGRVDFILRSVIQGLLAIDATNLVDAYSVLTDKDALRRLERRCEGSPLRSALRTHLPRLDYSITISSLDKVGKVATNPLLRKALCQRFGAVSFSQLLRHRLVLLNLGKGTLGTEAAGFLGAVFLTQLWSALQERKGGEPPVYLVVDEFPNYAVPSFADMLSEGARVGLHVVAITQYLERVPERVRSALVGNVDVWAMFPVGAEDMRETWKIVQGKEFGWGPEDLVSGLGPFQAALHVNGTLLKVTTAPPSKPSQSQAGARETVEQSTRRYACREDSQVSPLAVSQGQLVSLLGNLSPDAGTDPGTLGTTLGWTPVVVKSTIALGKATGDLLQDSDGSVRLLPRGRSYREAVLASRNEGEEHCGLLADAGAYLEELGVSLRIGVQEQVAPTPDGEFERNGRAYNLEVECSNLLKHLDQVVRNVRKALASGRRCLIAVSDREAAERVAGVLANRIPEAELWGEIGLLWRGGPGCMVPYPAVERDVWGWLLGREEPMESEPLALESVEPAIVPTPSVQSHLVIVRDLVERVGRLGKEWASTKDLLEARAPGEADSLNERTLGQALGSMRIPNRRVRFADGQIRIYHVGSRVAQD
ncbi:MAG TPA: DUF87 domain-containing protein [Thermoplasmata archaeon]|nr:DUF87 domain-containing protein [Thermoplasmata archaeon]